MVRSAGLVHASIQFPSKRVLYPDLILVYVGPRFVVVMVRRTSVI